MKSFRDEQVMNGIHGEVWVDDLYMAEATALEAKITVEKEEVNQAKRLTKGYKVTGIEGKGTLKLYKVSSYFIEKLSNDIKAGKTTTAKIISKLSDPDATGTETLELNGCVFEELTLADWERKKNGEESVPFTFTDWEIIDSAPWE